MPFRVRRMPLWSSTTRMLTGSFALGVGLGFISMFWPGHGQSQREHAALADLAFRADFAAMSLDDRLHDRQTQAGALRLRREQGLEDLSHVLFADSDARILERNQHAGSTRPASAVHAGGDL